MTFKLADLDFDNHEDLDFVLETEMRVPLAFDPSYTIVADSKANLLTRISAVRNTVAFRFILAKESCTIVGFHFISLQHAPHKMGAAVLSTWVDPRCRGRGIARALKAEGERWAIEQGASEVTTRVHVNNARMAEINSCAGYRPEYVTYVKHLANG